MKAIERLLDKYKNNPILVFFDKLFFRIGNKNLPAMAGSLTFFSILSIFPFIIAFLNIISFVEIFNQAEIVNLIKVLPEEIYSIIESFITQLNRTSSTGLLSISLILGIFSASSGVKQLLLNINKAYGIKDDRNYFFKRLISAIFTLLLMVMLILISVTSIVGEMVITKTLDFFKVDASNFYNVLRAMRNLIPIAYMLIIYIVMYYFTLNKKIKRNLKVLEVVPGAVFTTIGQNLFSTLFGVYLQNFAKYSVTYGSLGSIFAFLTWSYFMSYTMLIGAEINGVLYSMKYFKTQNLHPRYESVFYKNSN